MARACRGQSFSRQPIRGAERIEVAPRHFIGRGQHSNAIEGRLGDKRTYLRAASFDHDRAVAALASLADQLNCGAAIGSKPGHEKNGVWLELELVNGIV
jgi:hypothetical protein